MNVLGLSYGYHDSSAALIVDGKLVAASSEERHSRQKHDSFYPKMAIESCLDQASLSLSDIDQVAYYEKSSDKWTRVLSSSLKGWPRGLKEFQTSMKTWLGGKLWTEAHISDVLNLDRNPLLSFEHHLSHAAQAFLGSGFQDAAILTVDAVGEWETCTLYDAFWEDGKPHFNKIDSHHYPDSLGLFYSAITAFLGFRPMNDECSTMALAAFGSDRYLSQMREVVHIDDRGHLKLNNSYLNFDQYYQKPFSKKFIATFGEPYHGDYHFSCLEQTKEISEAEQRMADIAWAAQKVFEECVLKLLARLKKKSSSSNLCLAGGGALNCVANTKIINSGLFDQLYIPTEPGDGGAAIGAAFLGHFKHCRLEEIPPQSPLSLGQVYCDQSLPYLLDHLKPSQLQKYRYLRSPKSIGLAWQHRRYSEEELIDKVADYLHKGHVVGWFQQGAEFGPRALGHRSILFKADDINLAKRVSTTIKARAPFRPYALSMSREAAHQILNSDDINQAPFSAMQLAIPVHQSFHQSLRTGLHCDQTTRPQVVASHSHTLYHKLLKKFGELSGVEAFINTSFNESGYPIVESPAEALLMFARTDLDVLVMHDIIVTKERRAHD